jgi:hypothetical protein
MFLAPVGQDQLPDIRVGALIYISDNAVPALPDSPDDLRGRIFFHHWLKAHTIVLLKYKKFRLKKLSSKENI